MTDLGLAEEGVEGDLAFAAGVDKDSALKDIVVVFLDFGEDFSVNTAHETGGVAGSSFGQEGNAFFAGGIVGAGAGDLLVHEIAPEGSDFAFLEELAV